MDLEEKPLIDGPEPAGPKDRPVQLQELAGTRAFKSISEALGQVHKDLTVQHERTHAKLVRKRTDKHVRQRP